jgi:hypothetical protein
MLFYDSVTLFVFCMSISNSIAEKLTEMPLFLKLGRLKISLQLFLYEFQRE